MMVGALIDLGLPLDLLKNELKKLPIEDYKLSLERVKKSGIDSANFNVIVDEEKQQSRDYSVIKNMLESSSLKENIKKISLKIFHIIAIAEGKIHAADPEKVHFHEVGAIDSIVDIVSVAIGVDYLDIGELHCSEIITGTGMVKTDHGLMPVPAPATSEILKGVPLSNSTVEGELITPTGAAILKVLSNSFGEMPKMQVEIIGYGAGNKSFGARPNLLRIFLGENIEESLSDLDEDEVLIIETAIDDMNPQFFEPMIDNLFQEGALDVVMIPAFMKKGRPGTLLQVIAHKEKKSQIEKIIFSGSTSIGIRSYNAKRSKLKRSGRVISTSLGDVTVKAVEKEGGQVELRPEYDSLKKLAKKNGTSVREMSLQIEEKLRLQKEVD